MVSLPPQNWYRVRGVLVEIIISLILSVVASVIAYYICKWLDGE